MYRNVRNNKIIKLSIILVVIIILISLICLMVYNNNDNKMLECDSLNQSIKIKFKGNKPIYISGKINLNEELTEEMLQNITIHNQVLEYNKAENVINYAFSYDEVNSDVLNYIGLSYNKKDSYKTIKKYLETDNFYCK